tara:strand:+ start:768 stop:1853 length:1086 start_codon:yes stop_codon:yes gene_type:complete
MTYKKKIFIVSGGTGGHIFPALSLINLLKLNYKIYLVTDKRGYKYIKQNPELNIIGINSGKIFQKNILKFILESLKLLFAFIYSFFILILKRPKIVIGMGGYSSFPTCVSAFLLRIPVIIYENNLVIGKANRILLPFVKKILVSTNDIKGVDQKFKKKIFQCGYLIRQEILEASNDKKNIETEQLSLLILGGSQSAKIFGEVLTYEVIKCNQKGIKLKVFQQCLHSQLEKIKDLYDKNNIKNEIFVFSSNISKYYKQADFAITRSGASSIAELINLRVPFIAVPLPSSADNHQYENAKYYENKGYCHLLEEKVIKEKLFEIINNFYKDGKKLSIIKNKMLEHTDKSTINKIEGLVKNITND